MKPRYALAAIALVIAAAAVFIACGDTVINVGGPTQVVDVSQGGGSGPGASPSPGASGTCKPAEYVRVGFFGFTPTAGAPNNGQGVLPLTHTGHATATPKIAGGTDQPFTDHASVSPTWEITEGSAALQLVKQSNPFNADLSWRAGTVAGTVARVSATVCGVVGGFEFVAR